ncbi:uncharacterized protein LOC144451041 [Glandiceps talaboti]
MDLHSTDVHTLDFKTFIDYDELSTCTAESDLNEEFTDLENWSGKCKRSDSLEFHFDEDDFLDTSKKETPTATYLGLEAESGTQSQRVQTPYRLDLKPVKVQSNRTISDWLENIDNHWNVGKEEDIPNNNTKTMNRRNSVETVYSQIGPRKWKGAVYSNNNKPAETGRQRYERISRARATPHAQTSASTTHTAHDSSRGSPRSQISTSTTHTAKHENDSRRQDDRTTTDDFSHLLDTTRRSLDNASSDGTQENNDTSSTDTTHNRTYIGTKDKHPTAATTVSEKGTAINSSDVCTNTPKANKPVTRETTNSCKGDEFNNIDSLSTRRDRKQNDERTLSCHHGNKMLVDDVDSTSYHGEGKQGSRAYSAGYHGEVRHAGSGKSDHHLWKQPDGANSAAFHETNHWKTSRPKSANSSLSERHNRTFPPALKLALESYREKRGRSKDKDIEMDFPRLQRCTSPSLARGRRSPVVEVIRHSLATVQSQDLTTTTDLHYKRDRFYIPTFGEFKKMRMSGQLPQYDRDDPFNRQRSSSLRIFRHCDRPAFDSYQTWPAEINSESVHGCKPEEPTSSNNSPVHTPRIGTGKSDDKQKEKDIKRTQVLKQKIQQNEQINRTEVPSVNAEIRIERMSGTESNDSVQLTRHGDEIVGQNTDTSTNDTPLDGSTIGSITAGIKSDAVTAGDNTGTHRTPQGNTDSSVTHLPKDKNDVRATNVTHGNIDIMSTGVPQGNSDVATPGVSQGRDNVPSVGTIGVSQGDDDLETTDIGSSDRSNTDNKQARDNSSIDQDISQNQDKLKQMKENILGSHAKLLENEKDKENLVDQSDITNRDYHENDDLDLDKDEAFDLDTEMTNRRDTKDDFDWSDDDDLLVVQPIRRRLAVRQKNTIDDSKGEDTDWKTELDNMKQKNFSSSSDSEPENLDINDEVETPTTRRKNVGHVMAEWSRSKEKKLTKFEKEKMKQDIETVIQEKVKSTSSSKHKDRGHIPSTVSVSSVDSGIVTITPPDTMKENKKDIERTDSGVGSETGDNLYKKTDRDQRDNTVQCEDCSLAMDMDGKQSMAGFTVCRKCEKRRIERKETIMEIVQTEISYGDDLRLISQEFYKPIKTAALLSDEQLDYVFLNLEELIRSNDKLADVLQDALDEAAEDGDEDYVTVNFGSILLDNIELFLPFEEYCINQAAASVLLSNLESEKELLRVFLQVSQKDNVQLRKLHLKSFLMTPVQRITKYPLLLSRLHKTTPEHNEDVEAAKKAQRKVEEILEHINAKSQGVVTSSGKSKGMKRTPSTLSLNFNTSSAELKKLSLDTLGWNKEHVRFVKIARLQCAQPTEQAWQRVKKSDLQFKAVHVILALHGQNVRDYKLPDEDEDDNKLMFPRDTLIKQAALVIFRDRTNEKFTLHKDPVMLERCVVSSEIGSHEMFEIIDMSTNEVLVFKTDNIKECQKWIRNIRCQTTNLGSWRRRRNALANIMITSMSRV